jgi:hypothetical protein
MLNGYDAAFPPADPPVADVVFTYGGGDTPHVWTSAEIATQPARFRVPIWVRSDPGGTAQAQSDATAFVGYLVEIGCPRGVYTVLDLETAIDPPYVTAFGQAMHDVGWMVSPYGSSSTLFKNPILDGYFVAEPGASGIPANCVMCQHTEDAGGGAYDLDWLLPSLKLWDTWLPLITSVKEDDMSIAVAPDGTRLIERVSPAGHLLLFSVAPGTTQSPNPVPHVLDVTDAIAAANPGIPLYTVQP